MPRSGLGKIGGFPEVLGVEELPEPGPCKASEAAETLIVRSVSDEPRLRGRVEVEAETGDALLIRGSCCCSGRPFRFGRPGQFASIRGSDIGTDVVPQLETVEDASES